MKKKAHKRVTYTVVCQKTGKIIKGMAVKLTKTKAFRIKDQMNEKAKQLGLSTRYVAKVKTV